MAQLRPDPKLAKILYKIMKIGKDQQQKPAEPTQRQMKEWKTTYVKSSIR